MIKIDSLSPIILKNSVDQFISKLKSKISYNEKFLKNFIYKIYVFIIIKIGAWKFLLNFLDTFKNCLCLIWKNKIQQSTKSTPEMTTYIEN